MILGGVDATLELVGRAFSLRKVRSPVAPIIELLSRSSVCADG